MKIIKYEKKGNGKYRLHLENNCHIDLHEDTILKNNILYKKEIDEYLLDKINDDNNKNLAYDNCCKYISIRLRSINEIKEYLKRKDIDEVTIENIIEKLLNNNLLNEERFTKAFIKDKMNFSTMGPYRIEQELKTHRIDSSIINKYISELTDEEILDKIEKLVIKKIKSKKNKNNIRNQIYMNLISSGYPSNLVVEILNKYNL